MYRSLHNILLLHLSFIIIKLILVLQRWIICTLFAYVYTTRHHASYSWRVFSYVGLILRYLLYIMYVHLCR